MSETPKCASCEHWEAAFYTQVAGGLGRCKRALMIWDATEWIETNEWDEPDRLIKPEFADTMMFVRDGSDYMAVLLTKADFFCAHFEVIKVAKE